MKWIRDPKHKDKVITILVLLALGILSLLVVVSTIKLSSMKTNLSQMEVKLTELSNSIPKYEPPKNGYTPIKGVDYNDGDKGDRGDNGTNSVSTHTETTIIKEVPIKGDTGEKGEKGDTSPALIPVIDPETCILGFMREGDDFPRQLVKIPGCEAL